MTTPKLLMACGFVFIVGIMVSRIIDGAFFNASDAAVLNQLTVIRSYNVWGLFTIPWLNPDFFIKGIPKLVAWDFSFFGGDYEIFKYFLYVVSIGVAWGFFVATVGVLSQFMRLR